MHGGVDPSAALRHEDCPAVGSDGPGVCAEDVLRLVLRVELQQQCREITILTQVQEVLHVQRIDSDFRVGLDDFFADEQRLPCFGSADAVHGEATRKTSDGAKERFKSLCQVVRDVIFVHLYHGGHRGFRIS